MASVMANFMPMLVFSLCLCLSPGLSPLPSLPLSDIKCLVTQGHGYRMLSKQSPLPTLCLFKTRKWNRTLGKEALRHFRVADCSGQSCGASWLGPLLPIVAGGLTFCAALTIGSSKGSRRPLLGARVSGIFTRMHNPR